VLLVQHFVERFRGQLLACGQRPQHVYQQQADSYDLGQRRIVPLCIAGRPSPKDRLAAPFPERPTVGLRRRFQLPGIFTYRNVEKWTPLQQWYWTEYLTTKTFPTARGDYKLLAKVDGHGKQRMAVDADVVPGPLQGWPPFPFALTPQARQAGAVALKVDTVHYPSAQMNQMLSE
jgi:hypothetical protein